MYIMLFFFFKQKTAYEMRISDWSPDVCSSDLWRNSVGISLWHAPVAAAVVAGRTHEAGRSDCTRKRSLSNAASHGGGDAVDLHHGRSPETWTRDVPPACPRRHVRGGNPLRVRSFRRPHPARTPGHRGVPGCRRLSSQA